jgi:glycosyltransferase 2 family protein
LDRHSALVILPPRKALDSAAAARYEARDAHVSKTCGVSAGHAARAMKKILFRVFQLLVTAAILAWIFRDPQLRAGMLAVLRRANSGWLALGVLLCGVGEAANILRWHIFLRVQKIDITLWRTTVLFMIGLFFNLFLFGSMGGDIARAAYLSVEHRHKRAAVIVSVAIDRLIGLLILVPLGLAVVTARHDWLSQTPASRALLYFMNTFMACITAFFAVVIAITALGLVHRLPPRMPGRESLVRVSAACSLFGHAWRESLIAFALSIPVLFGVFVPFYCAARAFGANASAVDVFSIMPIITVVTSFPISFSGLGVREQLFLNLLGDLAHVPADVAVLISLGGFAAYVFWSLVGAGFYAFSKPAPAKST